MPAKSSSAGLTESASNEMEPEFWHERWALGETGFHQLEFNAHMQAFIDRLGVHQGNHIFVPLCGKSRDMLWLIERGYHVSGIEISRQAIEDFFSENQLNPRVDELPDAVLFTHGNLDIYCADFFKADLSRMSSIHAVYDRASLVALPPTKRGLYAERLTDLIPDQTRCLLLTCDYPQQEMNGPPFSVTPAEVNQLFGPHYLIDHVHSQDALVNEPRFRQKGLTRFDEHVFILQKKG